MKKLLLAGLIGISLPLFASAATLAELRAQLAAVMAQLSTLQSQPSGEVLGATTCPNLDRNMSRGARWNNTLQVTLLQQFLISQNYLAAGNDSGFYGALTEAAVKQFQCKTMNICSGSPVSNGYGAVGPATRTAISRVCSGGAPAPMSSKPASTSPASNPQVSAPQAMMPNIAPSLQAVVTAMTGDAPPTVTLTQSATQTASDGVVGDPFIVSWNSTNATSCTVQKTIPDGTLRETWGSGTSGSKQAGPFLIGLHAWWIDCTGPGGAARAEFTHSVVRKDTRPNIIVIMTDDQDDTGSLSTMPKLQSLLANAGVRFTNSFVDLSLCCPSRAAFITGQAAHNNGVALNSGYPILKPTEGNTLAPWLKQAGYTTSFIGKYLNGYDGVHISPGWDDWRGLINLHHFNYSMNENGVVRSYGSAATDYQTDVLRDKTVSFIGAQATSAKPYFIWVALHVPHNNNDIDSEGFQTNPVPAPRHAGMFASLPLPLPPNFNEADVSDKPTFVKNASLLDSAAIAKETARFRAQRESLLAVDDLVEKIVKELEHTGELANTIIVFTSDNGYSHGEHRRPQGKHVVYEESIRVPLVMRGPGIPAGQTRTQMVNNLDLVATIVEVARATPGRVLDGRTLAPLFSNAGTSWRSAILTQGNDTLGEGFPLVGTFKAVRSERYKYVEHTSATYGAETELYDLQTDPYELENKASTPAYAPVASFLQGLLAPLKTCVGVTCFVTNPITMTPSAAPTVNFTQTSAQTTSTGSVGQTFTVAWNSTGATSCTVQKTTPDGTLNAAWGSGTTGSKDASPFAIGTHRWWIDCSGSGGAAHAEFTHAVVAQ